MSPPQSRDPLPSDAATLDVPTLDVATSAHTGADIITVAVSHDLDANSAIAEIANQLRHSQPEFVLLMLPDGMDHAAVATAARQQLTEYPIFGCTTAGQITPTGYENNALLALAFDRAHFRHTALLISAEPPLSIEKIARQAQQLASQFGRTPNTSLLAITIADGLSKQEDLIVAALEAGLPNTPIFGGSAADGLAYQQTFVIFHGELHSRSALLLLLETDLTFQGLGFHHFALTDCEMVITKADPAERMVMEINGAPAAEEYARIVGVAPDELSPLVFAENPLLVRSGRAYHVRAIQQCHDDGALSFLCAIDDGLILTLGRGQEILHTLDRELELTDQFGNAPTIILGFDCFLRRLEIEHLDRRNEASQILRQHNVVGFNTYGEQHRGVHVNQTFVGVAFFPRGPEFS